MLTPETVISIKVVTCTLSLVCIIARYFIARQASGGIMSLRSSFSHFTLLVASLCDFSATGLSACALVAEIGYRKSGLSGSGLDDVLLLPKNSRVGFYPPFVCWDRWRTDACRCSSSPT